MLEASVLRGEVGNSESKTPNTAQVSRNQSLGYRKFKRSLNVEPLSSATLSPNLGKTQKCAACQGRGSALTSPHSPEPLNFQGEYGCNDKGMRVI